MDNDNSNRHCNKPYYINSANTWEYKTITFPPDTTGVLDNDNSNSFHFNFWHGGGTNFSWSSLQESWGALDQSARADGQTNIYGTNGATWQVTGVQLELGKVATPFEYRSYGEELALCQRYYQRLGNNDGSNTHLMVGSAEATNVYVVSRLLLTTMRAVPTISLGNAVRSYTATAGVQTVISFSTRCSRDIACISVSVTGSSTAGNAAVLYGADGINSTGKYIALDAEL